MIGYRYEMNGQVFEVEYTTIGEAINAALMDFSAGQARPIAISMNDYDVFDYGDLHWMYSRTWNAEYDRATGKVTPRGKP